jgi:serine phosphatase RsbU (regulator of sigma subunit)
VDSTYSLDLGTGDLIVLTTDGLHEWETQQGEQFGLSSGCSSDAIIQALYKAVPEFFDGTRQQGDLTAVVTLLFQRASSASFLADKFDSSLRSGSSP